MGDNRNCDQCGAEFAPLREHGRFCSARCRVTWNREHTGDRREQESALDWSITAMRDATVRLQRARAWDLERAFAVIGEAVWWVTIVDGTLVRYHPRPYQAVLAAEPPAERELIEQTMAGLRFVRNQMGHDLDHAYFIRAGSGGPGTADGRVTTCWWASVPEPTLAALTPRAQEWETARHQAYEAQLAGRPVGETFARAAAFLKLAAEQAANADHATSGVVG